MVILLKNGQLLWVPDKEASPIDLQKLKDIPTPSPEQLKELIEKIKKKYEI